MTFKAFMSVGTSKEALVGCFFAVGVAFVSSGRTWTAPAQPSIDAVAAHAMNTASGLWDLIFSFALFGRVAIILREKSLVGKRPLCQECAESRLKGGYLVKAASAREFAAQDFVDGLGIGLALGGLHHLTYKKAQ